MTVKNVIAGLLVFVAVSFAQSADSTIKSVTPQSTTVSTISTKNENKQLGKQKVVRSNTSTWSKIKDLFM